MSPSPRRRLVLRGGTARFVLAAAAGGHLAHLGPAVLFGAICSAQRAEAVAAARGQLPLFDLGRRALPTVPPALRGFAEAVREGVSTRAPAA